MRPYSFSASSFNTSNGCEMRYWLEKGLGYYEPAGPSAAKGTCYHSVMEALALSKLARQNGESSFSMDQLGGPVELDVVDNIDALTTKIYNWHIKNDLSYIDWKPRDLKEIKGWVQSSLLTFNPLKVDQIVGVEQEFDLELKNKWAQLDEEKYLKIKGFIDLVYIDDGILNVIDYKSGQRKDFYTGKVKTYADLTKDFQLLLYFYASNILYPENYGNIHTNIFFIKDGGMFTMFFDDADTVRVEKLIKDKFEYIKGLKIPRQNKSWRCKQFCPFYKKVHDDPSKQIIEFRNGKFAAVGAPMPICDHMHYLICKNGIEEVEKEYKVKKKEEGTSNV